MPSASPRAHREVEPSSTRPPLRVRRAGPRDVDGVLGLLEEAAAWSRERGIPMWPLPFPRTTVARDVTRGSGYVVEADGDLVATFALLWDDPPAWGLRPPDAGYLHRFAVRRARAGRGIGERLLDWAGATVAGAGRRWLRLDTIRANEALVRYYERHGFLRVGDATVADVALARFEREARPRPTGPGRWGRGIA